MITLHDVEEFGSVKTVKYVTMTEEIYAKFSTTEEECLLLKELPDISDERVHPVLDSQYSGHEWCFYLDHIKTLGLEPMIAVELCKEATTNTVDWITTLFYTSEKMAQLLSHAYVRVADIDT